MKFSITVLIAVGISSAVACHSAENVSLNSPPSTIDLIEPEQKIPLSLREFNQGRPANFYSLSYAAEGQSALCSEILENLNVEFPRESEASSDSAANLLLKSSLSVPWSSIPYVSSNGTFMPDPIDVYSTDVNGDGAVEQVFRSSMMRNSNYLHRVYALRENRFEQTISELTQDMTNIVFREGMLFGDGTEIGTAITNQITKAFSKYSFSQRGPLRIEASYIEVIELDKTFILLASRILIERDLDVFTFSVEPSNELVAHCTFSSNYRITNSN